MGNKTEELIAKIKQAKANRVKAIEKAKMEEERMYDNYQAEFSKLGERINTLITLGRTLLMFANTTTSLLMPMLSGIRL